jgi:hypothetical protein
MAQDNRNRDQQRQDQGRRQDNSQDELTRQGRSADDRDAASSQGGPAGSQRDADDLDDEMDEDRDDDDRPEGGTNRRKNIS